MDETLVMPDGSRYTFVHRPADPSREALEMEFLVMPGALAPPPHFHPGGQRETFEVLEGSFELRRGDEWHALAAGQSMTVAPGEVHTFRNRSGGPARVRNLHEPAHSFERYLRRLHAIVTQQGITSPTSPKAALHLALLWREHADTIKPAGAAMGAGMTLLAGAGRLLRVRLPD